MFAEVTGEKLLGGTFLPLPLPPTLLKWVNIAEFEQINAFWD